MKIFIGADHAGFKLKDYIKKYLTALEIPFEDLGNKNFDAKDDYPDFAKKVAKKVAQTKSKGILICSSGVGMCLTVNKLKKIRAANAYSTEIAKMSRLHNNTNILCLGADYISITKAKKIITIWLETNFSKTPKYKRRIDKIG